MTDFAWLVITAIFRIPAPRISSTVYWMRGLSITAIISLGMALVAGRKRVPNPAAGMIAFLTFTLPPRQSHHQQGDRGKRATR